MESTQNPQLSLQLAKKKVEAIGKLVDDDPSSTQTHEILRELSWLVYRVGEAIVDQMAAATSN